MILLFNESTHFSALDLLLVHLYHIGPCMQWQLHINATTQIYVDYSKDVVSFCRYVNYVCIRIGCSFTLFT